MILKYTNLILVATLAAVIAGCSSSSGSASAGTQVTISVAPSPVKAVTVATDSKTFINAEMDSITLTKAYLVVSSATIETSCGASFSAAAEGLLDLIIPQVNAHTVSSPTSTGEPYVINLLGVDGGLTSAGSLSPPAGDYCGVDIDMTKADIDANGLPADIDMIDKTLVIEGSYTLLDGVTTGDIHITTGVNLYNRELLLNALMMLSVSNLSGTIDLGISYDTWFDAVALDILESETAAFTDTAASNVNQVLQNIKKSIYQL